VICWVGKLWDLGESYTSRAKGGTKAANSLRCKGIPIVVQKFRVEYHFYCLRLGGCDQEFKG